MKVLLVIDTYGWAWDFMARGIAKYSNHSVSVMDGTEFSRYKESHPSLDEFDHICQFACAESKNPLPAPNSTLLAHPGWMYSRKDCSIEAARVATEIRCSEELARRSLYFDRILVKGRKLFKWTKDRHSHARYVVPGIDPEVFWYSPHTKRSELVVGWCGQRPQFGQPNQKGYEEILQPLTMLCGPDVRFEINERSCADALSQEEMAEWYRSIDLFLCTSTEEGGPMPVLEAMACGRPVLTTPCGMIPDLGMSALPAWNDQHSAERCIKVARDLLEFFAERKHGVYRAGERLAHQIKRKWTWEQQADRWIDAMTS